MNINHWLIRKFPNSFNKINEFLDETQLKELKEKKYRIGVLNKDIHYVQKYEKGAMVMWKRNKSWFEGKWDGTFNIYCVIKCQKGFTESGYHSIGVCESDIDEVLS